MRVTTYWSSETILHINLYVEFAMQIYQRTCVIFLFFLLVLIGYFKNSLCMWMVNFLPIKLLIQPYCVGGLI